MLPAIAEFIHRKDICVLATAAGGVPHCSLMAYLAADDALRLHFLSSRQTRKYANIQRNSQVSLLIDSREDTPTPPRDQARALTLSGTCAPMTEGPEKEAVRRRLVERHPHLTQLAAMPECDVLEFEAESCLLLTGPTEAYFEQLRPESGGVKTA